MRSTTPMRVPEEKLAIAGALGALAGAVVSAGVTLAVDSAGSALIAGSGAGLVALLALLALPLYRLGAVAGNDMVVAMAMAALGLRMMVALIVFAILATLTAVPMTIFAVGLAVGLVASIIAEMLAASRDPRFFWVSTTPSTTSVPAPGDTAHSGTERQLT